MGVGLQAPQAELRFDEQAGVTLIANGWVGALTHCMDDCLDESKLKSKWTLQDAGVIP